MSVPAAPKRWQTKIEIGINSKPIEIFGETILDLDARVGLRLLSDRPTYFSNVGDHITEKFVYFYHYGARMELYAPLSTEVPKLRIGWWCQEMRQLDGQAQATPYLAPMSLESLEEAVEHFQEFALIPEKGPDYRSPALEGSELRLPLLASFLRESDERPVNDLLLRGWHVVALEYKGEFSMSGELMNRKAVFVLGHPEAQAAAYTLSSQRYRNR